jgi:hypothetical protein
MEDPMSSAAYEPATPVYLFALGLVTLMFAVAVVSGA